MTHLRTLLGSVGGLLVLLQRLLLRLLLLRSVELASVGHAAVRRLLHACTCILEAAGCRGSALDTSLLLLVATRTIGLLLDARAALHLWGVATYSGVALHERVSPRWVPALHVCISPDGDAMISNGIDNRSVRGKYLSHDL